jgi:hypothetical protein
MALVAYRSKGASASPVSPPAGSVGSYEMRPGWPAIVQSIPCPQPGCGAQVGEPCRQVGAPVLSLAASQPRSDWHALRKYAAIQDFEAKHGS